MQGEVQLFLENHMPYVVAIRDEFIAYKTALIQICESKVKWALFLNQSTGLP